MPAAIILTAVFLLFLGAFASYAFVHRASQVLGKTIVGGDPRASRIALTFDDGPGEATERILDTLKGAGIQATFFLLAQNVEKYPELARRIASEGHEIGNHTYSHPYLFGMSPGAIAHEVQRAQTVIEETTGVRPSTFRPPYGVRWFGVFPVLENFNLTAVMWSVSSVDWKYSPERIVARVLDRTRNGSVVLFHDGVPPRESGTRAATAEALPEIVRRLEKNFQFVKISELSGSTLS